MEEDTTPKITEERIKKYLEQGKRFDGRNPGDFRELTIESGVSKKAEGSVRVRLGKTEVIVGVKMDVGEPYPDSGNKGNLMVTTELLPLSSGRIELGPPKIDSIELGRVIDRGIRESGFVDMEKLCIKENEKVWTVFVDIYSINDDGNMLDAAGIGAYAALKLAKMPKYDEETDEVKYGESDKDLPLTDKNPIVTTIYKIGNSLVVDPTREEEDVAEARITIGSSDKTISSVQKGGSKPFKVEEISEALDLAERKWEELFKNIEKQIKNNK